MRYDLNEHLEPRISGKVRWEHAEPVNLLNAANTITMGGIWTTYGGWFQKPGSQHKKDWARYFLMSGQGGGLTGEALVFVYGSGGRWNRENPDEWVGTKPCAYRVAICKHEKEEGAGANPSRGWHPGKCKHCGLDMTVDSGD